MESQQSVPAVQILGVAIPISKAVLPPGRADSVKMSAGRIVGKKNTSSGASRLTEGSAMLTKSWTLSRTRLWPRVASGRAQQSAWVALEPKSFPQRSQDATSSINLAPRRIHTAWANSSGGTKSPCPGCNIHNQSFDTEWSCNSSKQILAQ